MRPVATPTHANDTEASPRQIAFERARDAVTVIRTVHPMLTPSQAETLALLLDDEARKTIERSVGEAERGQHRPLKKAIDDAESEGIMVSGLIIRYVGNLWGGLRASRHRTPSST